MVCNTHCAFCQTFSFLNNCLLAVDSKTSNGWALVRPLVRLFAPPNYWCLAYNKFIDVSYLRKSRIGNLGRWFWTARVFRWFADKRSLRKFAFIGLSVNFCRDWAYYRRQRLFLLVISSLERKYTGLGFSFSGILGGDVEDCNFVFTWQFIVSSGLELRNWVSCFILDSRVEQEV